MKKLRARIEIAKFLQDTVELAAKGRKLSSDLDFSEFMKKVRLSVVRKLLRNIGSCWRSSFKRSNFEVF